MGLCRFFSTRRGESGWQGMRMVVYYEKYISSNTRSGSVRRLTMRLLAVVGFYWAQFRYDVTVKTRVPCCNGSRLVVSNICQSYHRVKQQSCCALSAVLPKVLVDAVDWTPRASHPPQDGLGRRLQWRKPQGGVLPFGRRKNLATRPTAV